MNGHRMITVPEDILGGQIDDKCARIFFQKIMFSSRQILFKVCCLRKLSVICITMSVCLFIDVFASVNQVCLINILFNNTTFSIHKSTIS